MIQAFNRSGLCISYNELERIDCSLANEIVNSCNENKVRLSPTITSASIIIRGAMDNYDHNEILSWAKDKAMILYLWYFRILIPQ